MDKIIRLLLLPFFCLIVGISFLNPIICMDLKEVARIEKIAKESMALRRQIYNKNEFQKFVAHERKEGLLWLGGSALSFVCLFGSVINYDFYKSFSFDSVMVKTFYILSCACAFSGLYMLYKGLPKILILKDKIKSEIKNKIKMKEKILEEINQPPKRMRGRTMYFYETLIK